MAEADPIRAERKGRPRSRAFLRLDIDNAYERLGISPLAPTEEISSRIAELRGEAARRVKQKLQRGLDDADEAEIHRLDQIHEEIGDDRRRRVYDEQNPQNVLLTVQPGPSEQLRLRHRRAALVTEWLHGELYADAFLPTPRSLRLWAPAGVPADLLRALAPFARDARASAAEEPTLPADDPPAPASIIDLDRLSKEG